MDADQQETMRLILVTRPWEHSGTGRQAFIVTLQSGKEIVLVVPTEAANELEKQGGWIGRIRPARDDDNIQIAQIQQPRKKVPMINQQGGQLPSTEVPNGTQ